jgi:hypothetical protein
VAVEGVEVRGALPEFVEPAGVGFAREHLIGVVGVA